MNIFKQHKISLLAGGISLLFASNTFAAKNQLLVYNASETE